jgi:hypothetical protein
VELAGLSQSARPIYEHPSSPLFDAPSVSSERDEIGVTGLLKPAPLQRPQVSILSTLHVLPVQNESIFELILMVQYLPVIFIYLNCVSVLLMRKLIYGQAVRQCATLLREQVTK